MSIHKKSLISNLKTTKKANVAKAPSLDASVSSGKKSPVVRLSLSAKASQKSRMSASKK